MSLLFNNNIENTKVYAFVGPSGTGKVIERRWWQMKME